MRYRLVHGCVVVLAEHGSESASGAESCAAVVGVVAAAAAAAAAVAVAVVGVAAVAAAAVAVAVAVVVVVAVAVAVQQAFHCSVKQRHCHQKAAEMFPDKPFEAHPACR